ncbi:MAG: cupin domain-containing protein [Bacteroidota bacterium]
MPTHNWINSLQLQAHPEGGYYKETYKSAEFIPQGGLPARFPGPRSFSTAIYFLLQGADFSAFHRLKADEVWHFYAGTTLRIHQISSEGEYEQKDLGILSGTSVAPQAVVHAGTWFGAEVLDKTSYALVGCTMAPGFDFADFEMPSRAELLGLFPKYQEVILRLTRV